MSNLLFLIHQVSLDYNLAKVNKTVQLQESILVNNKYLLL